MGVHGDTVQGLQEALAYAKGELPLKAITLSTQDDISFKYNQLPEDVKQAIMTLIDNALIADNR